jgi:hypothetical protein
LALPAEVARPILTTFRDRFVKIDAKIVYHYRSTNFRMAKIMAPG